MRVTEYRKSTPLQRYFPQKYSLSETRGGTDRGDLAEVWGTPRQVNLMQWSRLNRLFLFPVAL